MKSDIFIEFLKKLNHDMAQKNRKIALILDNCSSHPFITLSNIKLIFLPPNTTSVLQPMDMGVIHALKCKYRVKLAKKLLAILEINPKPTVKDIGLYEALLILKQSWDEVSEQTIKNCFVKSGFKLESNAENLDSLESNFDIEFWDELTQQLDIEGADFLEFVDVDNQIATSEEPVFQTAVENNKSEETVQELDKSEDTDEYEFEGEEYEKPVKLIEALNSISNIKKYITQCEGLESSHELLDKIESDMYENKFKALKQKKITHYFH
jgi:hypothetical protein